MPVARHSRVTTLADDSDHCAHGAAHDGCPGPIGRGTLAGGGTIRRYPPVVNLAIRARQRRRLSTQVLVLLLGIVVLTVLAGSLVAYVQTRDELDKAAGTQSLAIARAVASDPPVVAAFSAARPAQVIDPIAENFRRATGAAFIVVANRRGIRYSHPNETLIGTSLLSDPGENPRAVLAGRSFVGKQQGSLGWSMRAKVPIRDSRGGVIGLVSVGVLETSVSARLRSQLPAALVPPLLGLVLGTVGALLLARRVKRQTFGLEPAEIGTLLEHREAMLHGVREGAVTLDAQGRITLVNDEAHRLVGLPESVAGSTLADVVPPGRVRDVLTGQVGGRDEVIVLGQRTLVVNYMPVEVRGQPVGAVITLRDRTEVEGLAREVDDLRALSDALRAQEHDFAHRLHVIGGLIELGRYNDAVASINLTSGLHQELAASLVDGIGDPVLSALLLGKAAVASERGVTLQVSSACELPDDIADAAGLVTVLGNLVDNAVDSASGGSGHGVVQVGIAVQGTDLVLRVHDSGPGIEPGFTEEIFRDGFTTKVAQDVNRRRGLGLALVRQEVLRRQGRVWAENVDGALFTVVIPLGLPARRVAELAGP